MQELSDILREATARVTRDYYRLTLAGGDPIYRERVYCYELYHQMRILWPPRARYLLNGEVDKAAHPILRNIAKKPDLLVHQPGRMEGNHAIIEVKSADVQHRLPGLDKDVETLLLFRRRARYERGILLIYGEGIGDVAARARSAFTRLNGDVEIEVWLHPAPGHPAEMVDLLQPPQEPGDRIRRRARSRRTSIG